MRQKFTQLLRLLALVISVAFLAKAQAAGYDVVNRFKILEDKMKTQEMLTPIGHDFFIDLGFLFNKDVKTILDDGKAVSDTPGGTTEKLDAANTFLQKYDKTEQNVRVGLKLGFPLPSFTAWDVKIIPNIRVGADVGVMMGIQTQPFSFAQILDYVGSDVPAEIKTAILSCSEPAAGADIVKHLVDSSCITDPIQVALAQTYYGKYYKPSLSTVPVIHNYAKAELKGGLYVNYEKGEHWFGGVNLYGMGRIDIKAIVSADSLANSGELADLGKEKNTTVNMATDLKFGYKNGRLSGFAAVEELKVARMSDNEDKGVSLLFGDDPLLRLHGEYLYTFSGFNVHPFVGVHQRSGYGFGDGIYGGSDLGFFVWGERIGVNIRGMIDNEHFTFSPMAKLWIMHLQGMIKVPVKSEVNGVKPATIVGANFRLFF